MLKFKFRLIQWIIADSLDLYRCSVAARSIGRHSL